MSDESGCPLIATTIPRCRAAVRGFSRPARGRRAPEDRSGRARQEPHVDGVSTRFDNGPNYDRLTQGERMSLDARVQEFVTAFGALRAEVEKVIVGHREIIDNVLMGMFAGGHVLLEGVPGLGKTLLVRTLAEGLELSFSRIQFTPDLMPADILGTNIIVEDVEGRKHFQFQSGPIFANVLLADEINRATPKTQSALLEGMQEASVTVGGVSRPPPAPFFVLATQNPIEMEGTYPLPEAQLDRFIMKLRVRYPAVEELNAIIDRTTQSRAATVSRVVNGPAVMSLRELFREVAIASAVRDFASAIVMA